MSNHSCANGRTGREWKKLLPYLRSRLGSDCNVVNGFFWGGKPVSKHDLKAPHTTALGLIPLGTGSDFARTFGWTNDPVDAIEPLVKGSRSWIDVGAITKEGGDLHYFISVADIRLIKELGIGVSVAPCHFHGNPFFKLQGTPSIILAKNQEKYAGMWSTGMSQRQHYLNNF